MYRISKKLILYALFFGILGGCSTVNLNKPRNFSEQSQAYYQRAVNQYQRLIRKNKDSFSLRMELSRLYYRHGDYPRAISELKEINQPQARKLLAIIYYKSGNFVDALDIFSRHEFSDEEYLFYHALTCERLNLFDQALGIYAKIKGAKFAPLALERINAIEKKASPLKIKDIDQQVAAIVANAPAQEKYPQAGALILFCDEKIEISPENTEVYYLHSVVKILNERGKEAFAELVIDYDSTFEKVELEYARTIKPDATVVEVGRRHIRDVSKYLNFPLYSNARAYIISFPEIAEGASIDYKVKVSRNKLINKKDFSSGYALQASEPVISAGFSVQLPGARKINLKNLNEQYNDFGANLSPQLEESGQGRIYRWKFRDIPQIIPESNMPPEAEINPALLISTFQSWQDIYQWWWQLARDKIKADASIKDKVRELIKDLDTQESKARAIYNFCAKNIRYVGVEYGQAGHEPHLAGDIFKNKYGDCKDQAILLVTMLKEAGLTAWPLLIGTRGAHDLNPDFPAVLFNHCIACLYLDDKIIFLDPTAETCSFGDLPPPDQKRGVLIFKDNGYEVRETPFYPAGHNSIKHDLSITVNSDETVNAEKSVNTLGVYEQAQRHWLLYTPPELIRQQLQEKIQDISIGAKLKNYDLKNVSDLDKPVLLSYIFSGPEYFTNAGNLRILPQLASFERGIVSREKRRYPIDRGILDTNEVLLRLKIPEDFQIVYLPADISEDNPWFTFSVQYRHQNNEIYFRQRSELKKETVERQEYADFKKLCEELGKKIKQRIVLEKSVR